MENESPRTQIIIGQSADTEAEYGSRADAPFTVVCLYDGEAYSVEGFSTFAAAKAEYAGDPAAQYIYL